MNFSRVQCEGEVAGIETLYEAMPFVYRANTGVPGSCPEELSESIPTLLKIMIGRNQKYNEITKDIKKQSRSYRISTNYTGVFMFYNEISGECKNNN
uniref:Uncharacterized protein n=1 Tax=Romanomermis culicivorax TaxID=13658 RepID=A0A915KHI0_ROMCU